MRYYSWFDPESWISGNFWARPKLEKVPCSYDYVEFPYGENTAVYINLAVDITVKGSKLNKKKIVSGTSGF